MYRIIFFIFTLLIITLNSEAQNNSTKLTNQDPAEVETVDFISYDHFLRHDWKLLINYSEKALNNNIDFYYLRLRLGIAYYELHQYRKALYHFEKAYQMDNRDELLKEYLYYCYLFTDQYSQALKISKKFSDVTLKKTNLEYPSGVFLVNVEYGNKLASDTSLYKTLKYFQAGIGFKLGRGVTAYSAFTNITQQMYYGTLSQQQLYASINIPLNNSWAITPAFHFINYAYNNQLTSPPPKPGDPKSSLSSLDGTSYVGSISISKNWKDFLFNGGLSYSTLNKAKQYQQQFGVSWFPLHNNKLTINPSLTLFSNDSGTSLKPIISFSAKYFLHSKFSVAANYSSIETKNFNELNGYSVNNSDDITHERFTAVLDLNCYKNINIFGVYVHESKTEAVSLKDYNFNTGIIGIKLTF